ncbi:hypothetical protein Tco_0947113, partial [Tanacetum coccineum]
YHITESVHPELPGPNQSIRNSPDAEFSAEACNFLTTHPAPFRRFSEPFLCLVGLSRYYELDDNMYPTFLTDAGEEIDLFAFILHADPTKVRIGKRQIEEGQVSLLDSTEGRVIPLVGEDDHDGQNDNIKNLNEGSGDADQENHSEEGDRAGQDEAVTIVVDYEFRVAVANKPKSKKKRRPDGVGGSNNPLKKLREDHGISGDAGVSTGGKYLAAVQDLFERSTLNVEVDVVAAATVPFVTSSMTPTPKREGGGNTNSVSGPNLCNQRLSERFVISSDSSHHSSTNAADVEFTSLVRSFVSPPLMMTAAVTTTNVAGTSSAPVIGAGAKPVSQVRQSLFTDSASIGATGSDIAGPSHLADYDQLFDEFNVRVACQTCLSADVRMQTEHIFRERKRFEGKCARQADLLKERDVEISNLKASLSLKEVGAAKAIRLRSQVSVVEAAKAARISELDSLKERNLALDGEKSTLKGQVVTLESATATKDVKLASLNAQVAKLTHDLSSLYLCWRPHVPDSVTKCQSMNFSRNNMKRSRMNRLSRHEVSSVTGVCYRFGNNKGLAIDKGMQTGLVAGVDYGKVRRGLADIFAYDPSMEAKYISVVLALCGLDFGLLSQLESQKDASITDIMSLLYLEGPFAETPEMWSMPMFRRSRKVLYLVVHLSLMLWVFLVDPLSSTNLLGEVSTLGISATITTTTTLSVLATLANVISVLPVYVADYGVQDAGPHNEAPLSPKIVFEKEDLETIPEHPSTS